MTTTRQRQSRGGWLLWFGLAGGLTAWLLHLAIGFVIVHDGCAVGLTNVRLLVGTTTLALALVAAGAVWSAYRIWHEAAQRGSDEPGVCNGRRRFMAILGVWLSGLSLLIIVALAIPTLLLNPCG